MLKKILIATLCALPFFGIASEDKKKSNVKLPSVVATPVTVEDYTPHVTEIGTVQSEESVDLVARVTGTLSKVNFKEGDHVEKGALLFEIDPAEFEANVRRCEAQIKALEAEKQRNQSEFDRNEELLKTNAVSVRDYQRAEANLRETEANILSAKAELDLAKLDLSYTKITAPFPGYMGFKSYSAGNTVGPESGKLATIEMSGSAKVIFNLPETSLVKLIESAEKANKNPNDAVVEIYKQDGGKIDLEGKLTAWDNKINQKTGTLKLQALFKDPKRFMIPGLYVKVQLQVGEPEKLVALRKSAVTFDVAGASVYILKDAANGSATVEKRYIVPAFSDAEYMFLKDGVKTGELLVVGGIQKIRPNIQCAYTLEGHNTSVKKTEPVQTNENTTQEKQAQEQEKDVK